MNNAKFTIIMASNNNAQTVVRALDSIVANSKKPSLIVIGDDDSKDDTYSILCKNLGTIPNGENEGGPIWPPKHETVYRGVPTVIFRKEKGSIGQIFNICIRMTANDTDIYGFLNPMDWYDPETIQKIESVFLQHTYCSCVVANCIDHFIDGSTVYNIKRSYDIARITTEYEYSENLFIPKVSFAKINQGFNEGLDTMYDYEIILKLSKIGMIYHIADFLYHCTVPNISQQTIDHIEKRKTMIRKQNG